ncbi:MAG: class I SAM-dependent methyltransferase [Planctomycetota bacterium]
MLIRLAMKLSASSPRFKRLLWRRWYEYLASYKIAEWGFMNYGYAPLDASEEPLALHSEDESNRYAIQLYWRVARAVELQGRQVLEVGCGRGGGSSFVTRHVHPSDMTAVDFSAKAVRFCQTTHQIERLRFVQGDAEALPFDDESFDAVINVESSHCYGSMPAFLREVKRVLRPGGHFLFADLRGSDDCDRLDAELAETEMSVLEKQDVTANVLEALRLDSQRKLDLIQRSVSKRLVGTFRQFAAIEGSEVFDGFKNGTTRYLRYVLQKKK